MSSRRYWSATEDTLLRERYPTASNADLQSLFPERPLRGIVIRANRLGVTKRKEYWELGMPFTGSVIGHLSETDKAYLAGILDGEGCIRLSRHRSGTTGYVYHIQITISNTSNSLMKWLDDKLPGTAYSTSLKPQQNGAGTRKPAFNWVLAGNRRATVFLREIAPYLVIKKPQADLLASGYVHLSDDDRDAMYRRLAELKLSN